MPSATPARVIDVGRKPSGPRDRIDLRADPELVARIERMRQRWGESISQYIRRAIIERLERDESSVPPKPPKS